MFTKPSNLSGTIAYQAVQAAAADITFAARAIGFVGLGESAILNNITSVSTTPFSAGVAQENTLDFTAIALTADTVYTLAIRRFDTNQVITYQIITPSSGVSAASIAEQFNVQLQNDLSCVVTSSRAGAVLTVVEKDASVTKGLSYIVPTAVVNVNTVVHVDQSGTLAEVQVYDSSVTAGDYRKYTINYNKLVQAPAGGQWYSPVVLIVWANEVDPDEADFLLRFDEIMAASNLTDAAAEPYVEVTA